MVSGRVHKNWGWEAKQLADRWALEPPGWGLVDPGILLVRNQLLMANLTGWAARQITCFLSHLCLKVKTDRLHHKHEINRKGRAQT